MTISAFKLFKSISEIVDMYNRELKHHHLHVAILCYHIGHALGWDDEKIKRTALAAIIHDLGVVGLKEKKELLYIDCINPYPHAILGYQILRRFEPLSELAEIIKYHHIKWFWGKTNHSELEQIPEEAYLVHFADRIDVLIDYNKEILGQVQHIKSQILPLVGEIFKPEIYNAFEKISEIESIWLDIFGMTISDFYKLFEEEERYYQMDIEVLAENITKITDYRSSFLNSHSITVGHVAEKISELIGLTTEEILEIKIAGFLHDIGKLVVENEVLEKTTALTVEEFRMIKKHPYYTFKIIEVFDDLKDIALIAASHHERIDGQGYPFKNHLEDRRSQIVAIADTFTALFENRSYRNKLSKEHLLNVMNAMVDSGKFTFEMVSIINRYFGDIKSVCESIQQIGTEEYSNIQNERNFICQQMNAWDLQMETV